MPGKTWPSQPQTGAPLPLLLPVAKVIPYCSVTTPAVDPSRRSIILYASVNASLLQNIRTVDQQIFIHCNAGTRCTNQQGELPGFGTIWYFPAAIANILFCSDVARRYRVKFDSCEGNKFVVYKPEGERVFQVSTPGLYYINTDQNDKGKQVVFLVATITAKKASYTKAEVRRGEQTRNLQRKIGRPPTHEFIRLVAQNLLPNCPVTKRNINSAEDIFGPDAGFLKGRTVRRNPPRISTDDTYSPLPPSVHERYYDVTLCADIMYVNGIPIFIYLPRHKVWNH
jgi:Cadherin prodomain like